MPKTQLQREPSLTKENHPNNQQTYYLQNKIRPEYEQSIGKEYSKINVVEELSVTEEGLTTGSIYDGVLDNNLSASDFQDAICGEPMKQQIIRLDFTPVEGVDDNEEVLKKCHSFWEFLKGHPEMQEFKVLAEKHQHKRHQDTQPLLPLSGSEATIDHSKVEQMSAINWVNKEDIMTNAIRTLEPQRYCEHFNEDYCDTRDSEQRKKIAVKKSRSRLATIKPLSISKMASSTRSGGRSNSVSSSRDTKTSLYNVEELVAQMKAWDLQHSRSLDPPHFPQEAVVRPDDVDTGTVSRKISCCQLSCIPECPSAAENTTSERQ